MTIRVLTVIILLLCIARMIGHTGPAAAAAAIDTVSPFFDIFYIYFGESKQKAKSSLKDLMGQKSLRGRACVNYGHICEIEKRPDDAMRYYKRALEEGERTALPYLYALQRRLAASGTEFIMSEGQKTSAGMWTSYEMSILELERGHPERALAMLDEAIRKGFNSKYLLETDPQWALVRDNRRFRELCQLSARNHSKTLASLQLEAERKLNEGTFLEINKNLQLARELETRGRLAESLRMIEAASTSRLPFHEKSISLYWTARLNKKMNNTATAKKYLEMFLAHLSTDEADTTGYKEILRKTCHDIIVGDPLLKPMNPGKTAEDPFRK